MSKFTLFTLFLCTMIMVMVAELLVNDYLEEPKAAQQLQANVLQGQGSMQTAQNTSTDPNSSFISFTAIGEAGFENITLQRVPFNGILFETLDLRDFKSTPVLIQNFLKDNRETVVTTSEFRAQNPELANEIYGMLKEKAGKLIGASVNETNSFGDRSFYINFLEHKEHAFLVVKQGENVYALTYQKGVHQNIQMLLALLP